MRCSEASDLPRLGTMAGVVPLVVAWAAVVHASAVVPSDPKTVAKRVGDAFLKSSSPPIQRASGE